MELDKLIKELSDKVENIDKDLKQIKEREKERKNGKDIGVISIDEDRLKIELLLNANDFSDEHIQRLTQIADDLQNLLSDVYKEVK